jgi:hypothetical protein
VAYFLTPTTNARQILTNSVETLSVTAYSDEAPAQADGAVTLGIVDSAGNTIVAAGTSATSAGNGVYNYILPTQTEPKQLIATWSGTWAGSAMSFPTFHEVVAGQYTNPAEVRAMDSINGEATAFPTSDIIDAIGWAENVVEDFCGTNWVGKFQREELNGTNSQELKLTRLFPRQILSASINGVNLTAPQIADISIYDTGLIRWGDDIWEYYEPGLKTIINYTHGAGEDTGAPNDLRWAVRSLARFHLIDHLSRIPDRALSIQSEFGQIMLAQPSMDRPTPLPDVNVILQRHRHRAPVVI